MTFVPDTSLCLNAGGMKRIDGESDANYGKLQGASGQDAKHGHSHLVPIGFSCKDHAADAGEISPTLRSMDYDASHANGGGQVAVAFQEAQTGVREGTRVRSGMAVRRLTPRECERLQGFPDDYTLVPYRGRMMADGPRYKMLGNSWAVPCARWIFDRIDAVERILQERAV